VGGTAGSAATSGGTGGPGSTGSATGGGGVGGGPGAATGGGGGTAAGGSGISASVVQALNNLLGGNPADALRGAVNNAAIDFGGGGASTGVPSLGVPEGVGGPGAAPTGTVAVNSLGPPSLNSSVVSALNSALEGLAQQAYAKSLQGGQTMGFPAIEGASPGLGGFGGSPASPGPTQGSPSMIGPAGPDGPSVAASEASTGQAAAPAVASAANQGIGPAAQTAQAQTNAATQAPSTVSTPTTTAPSSPTSPDMGGIFQLLLGLFGGQPELTNLALNALMTR
jgi:hypothetical protein